MDLIAFLLSPLLLGLLFFLNSLISHFTRSKLPPGPIGLPIFGNFFQFGPKPHVSFARLAEKYGPLMSIWFGSTRSVIVSSPEIARAILQKHDDSFCDREVPEVARGAQTNFDIFTVWLPANNRWRMLRQALNTQMTHAHKLDSLVELRHKASRELVEYVKEVSLRRGENGDPTSLSIGNLAFATTLNQMSKTCFSENAAEYESMEIQGLRNAVKTIMYASGEFNITNVFPWLKIMDPLGLRRKFKEAYECLDTVIDIFVNKRVELKRNQISNSKLSSTSSTHVQRDLLDSFIEYSLKDPDFTTQQFKALLLELIIAGTDTTSVTVEWAMTELLLNPDTMEKVRQEITEAVGTKGNIEERDIINLPYLQAIIKETLRLRIAVPLLIPHKSKEDVEINGYVIPKNTKTIINAWAIARDPCYWEAPNKFLPERFLNSDLDYKGQYFEFIPFGSGRRICPGMLVGQRMASLIIASLVYHFDWKLPRGTTIGDYLDIDDAHGLTLRTATPLLGVPTLIKDIIN